MNKFIWANILLLFLSAIKINGDHDTIAFQTPTGSSLGGVVTVGEASDVLIEVVCVSDHERVWSNSDGSEITSPLEAFGVSQNPSQGVLRIYPSSTVMNSNMFTCIAGGNVSRNITFVTTSSLFFTEPLPLVSSSSPFINCSLPNLPASNVTNRTSQDGATSFQYCDASSDRGMYQSGLVPLPQFTVQPTNSTVRTNDTAAFTCSIRPEAALLNITWIFQPLSIIEDSEMVDDGIVEGLAHTGTSVLVRSNVTDMDAGYYSCVAYYSDGTGPFTSERALLDINDTTMIFPFILQPHFNFTIPQGSTVTIPCLTRLNNTWILPSGANASGNINFDQTSLTIINATPTNNGFYNCIDANEAPRTLEVLVLAPLQFTDSPSNETTVVMGNDVTLSCVTNANNNMVTIRWLLNGTDLNSNGPQLNLTNIRPGQSGIYQCIAQYNNVGSPFVRITALTYLLVQFITTPTITLSPDLIDPLNSSLINIPCIINGQPLVNITWDVERSPPFTSLQSPVGFRGPAVSILTINSSELSGVHEINCTGRNGGGVVTQSANLFAFSPVTITASPMDTSPILVNSTATFSCSARSIPEPTITWYRSQGGNSLPSSQTSRVGVVTTSTLVVNTTSNSDFTEYFCSANNTRFSANSSTAMLVMGAVPVISGQPSPIPPVVSGDTITISCNSTGFPRPTVSWFINMATLTPSSGFFQTDVNITDRLVMSSISGPATGNETNFQCLASNRFTNNVRSNQVTLIIAGPPLAPVIGTPTPEARTTLLTWSRPFTYGLPITNYTVTLTPFNGGDMITFSVTNENIIFNSTTLSPYINYSVSVSANSRAGLGGASQLTFRTAEAAPDGSPTIILTSSTSLGSIFLSWAPINSTQLNGRIVSYIVQAITGSTVHNTSVIGGETSVTIRGLLGGIEYTLRIRGLTDGGVGPFSDNRTQTTIQNPPNITGDEPAIPSGQSVTTNTIPFNLPPFNASTVEFVWVVVIKLNDTLRNRLLSATPPNPDDEYPNNNTFLSLNEINSPSTPAGRPYVAAEITVSSFTFPFTFIIGSTSNVNDDPSRYANPPLAANTGYTFFVRAFPPAVASSSNRAKRQTTSTNVRQYSVFSSTQFSRPQSTAAQSSGLSDGVVAAIVIVILVLFLILVVLIVIAFLLFFRPKAAKFIPPPAARRGSMRLTESQKLLAVSQATQYSNNNQLTVVRKSAEFAELTPTDQRKPLTIEEFPPYVKRLHANSDHLFSEEYELISIKSPSLPHEASLAQCNMEKNRYGNINSFDNTRVHLTVIPGVEGSDYINANYIDGYGSSDTYIACQGPLPETSQDFWRMIIEQKCSCIVMLTNCVEKGRPKCHQYWPQSGSANFGDLSVTIIDQQVLAYYTIRTFKLCAKDESHEVKQFHYTAWPDFGVPDHPNPILSFIRRINNYSHTGPLVVHCSAGVGRSGTFIAIQSMMLMMETEGRIDVFNFVLDMRHKRNYMVQTEAQYMFVHDALLELIRVGNTEVTVQNFPKEFKSLIAKESETTPSLLEQQFDKLNAIDVAIPSQFISATLPVNQAKNRYPDILPYESYRVRLLMLPGVNGSDYINASYVDGYLRCNQFIMTQGPLRNTVDDFWRMIWEHRASAIVMLSALKENGKEQSALYWPSEELHQYGDMFVETVNETDTGFYIIREMQITHTKQGNEVRQIKQFHYTGWSEEQCPSTSAPLMDMIGLVQKAHHLFGGGPVVVHDSSSIGRAGTFCILNIVIERLKVEGMVDIFFSIHALRRKHPGIVATYDQFQFCYSTIVEYLNSFDKYANFD